MIKIVVTGTRGIPDIQGGVETHCDKLYPLLVDDGCDVMLIRRSCYVTSVNVMTEYKGVKLKDVYAPKKKSFEALIHTFLSVLYAWRQKPDIIHFHAIGPALLIPLARILGLKVVMTHHGADYERQKWGRIAKLMLKTGEKFAAKYAHHIISISTGISDSLAQKYNRTKNVHLIYNGVDKPLYVESTGYIESLGLEKGRYIFSLGRFVEEKGFHNLIDAYRQSNMDKSIRLVIAGDADHESYYSRELKKQAKENGVILTGFIKGEKLAELFSHAGLFVLPSYHEGLPISLLEAMSYGLNILASNIPANLAVELAAEKYFDTDNIKELSKKIKAGFEIPLVRYIYDLKPYDWQNIASQTFDVYKNLAGKK